jgi:peptidoglycan/LPS O-acetylase OafA/YrhL
VSTAFAANLSPLFGIAMEYPPLWSLAVEEHFYTVWPALVRRLTTRTIALTAVALVLASPAIRAWAFSHHYRSGIYFYSWFNIDGLATGALLAVLARHGRRVVWTATIAFVAVAVVLLTAAFMVHADITTRETLAGAALQSTILYLSYGALVSLVLLAGSSRLRGFVRIALLQWLGYISYGLYLVHVACFGLFDQIKSRIGVAGPPYGVGFVLLRFAVGGGIAIGIAALSRRYYEGYFLSLKSALTSEPESPAKIS